MINHPIIKQITNIPAAVAAMVSVTVVIPNPNITDNSDAIRESVHAPPAIVIITPKK
jgi:hypothetical protein